MNCTLPEKDDFKPLLKFVNKVFKEDFLSLVPKVYNDEKECLRLHAVCKENGKITGAVCVYPSKLILNGSELGTIGIGSVAVDKNHRGKGIMRRLMEYSEKAAQESDADIGFLCGARGRYERYGYVPCGIVYLFEISEYNLSHQAPLLQFTFERLQNRENDIAELVKIYEKQPVRRQRDASHFYDIAGTWKNRTYTVRTGSGTVCGFITVNQSGKSVEEIYLSDDSPITDILLCFANYKKLRSLSIRLYDFQRSALKIMLSFAEYYSINTAASIKIFNFKNTIKGMLTYKLGFSALPEGQLRLKIGGEIYLISIKEQKADVVITDGNFDIEMTQSEATIALCTYQGNLYPNPLMASWSPICPISLPHTDDV